jgi:hypothetical protein
MILFYQSVRVSAQVQKNDTSQPTNTVSQIYSTLISRFRNERPGNIRVELDDIGAYQADPIVSFTKANRFIVLARCFFYDTSSHSVSDLLGVFIFDDSLTTILRTIDMISGAHEHAYKITKVWKDTLTIRGEGFGHDWPTIEKKYKLYFWKNYK